MLKYILLLFLASCADDGSFNFSRTESNTNSNNTTITIEPRETSIGGDDGDSGNGDPSQGSNPVCTEIQSNDDGFLSKPVSDSDGNLVILLPRSFSVRVEKLVITDGAGNVEEGRFSDFGNGERQHHRFSKPGSEYIAPLRVTAYSLNGECEWIVSDPSQRTE